MTESEVGTMYDLLIIGGGPAGLSAAMTARNRNLSVCVICGGAADSALYKAGHVTNYPGVPDVSGPAKQRLDPGYQLQREKGLNHIVIAAKGDARDPVHGSILG